MCLPAAAQCQCILAGATAAQKLHAESACTRHLVRWRHIIVVSCKLTADRQARHTICWQVGGCHSGFCWRWSRSPVRSQAVSPAWRQLTLRRHACATYNTNAPDLVVDQPSRLVDDQQCIYTRHWGLPTRSSPRDFHYTFSPGHLVLLVRYGFNNYNPALAAEPGVMMLSKRLLGGRIGTLS